MRRPAELLFFRCIALVAALLWSACATSTPRPSVTADVQPAPGVTPVTAVLFGYIPDAANDGFASLTKELSQRFESATQIPAQITIDSNLNLYDFEAGGELSKLLGNSDGAVDVVEVDTLLLGTLVANKWIQQLNFQPPDGILPSAMQAATVNSVVYGIPTYLCTNVIYAYDAGLTAVQNGNDLLSFLIGLSPGDIPLVGNYAGSWTLPGTYLDAWADTNGTSGLAGAYLPPVDGMTMSTFDSLVESCMPNPTINPCLDGTYSSGSCAETAFATSMANGFVGYTERLFYILTVNPTAQPYLISAPLGDGSDPVMFVDALVVNPNCTGVCLENATRFIQFMSQVSTRNLIAFSQDAKSQTNPSPIPRYLLQANEGFYQGSPASQDPYYPQFWTILQNAAPFPNQGFPQDRKNLGKAIKAWGTGSTATEKHH